MAYWLGYTSRVVCSIESQNNSPISLLALVNNLILLTAIGKHNGNRHLDNFGLRFKEKKALKENTL